MTDFEINVAVAKALGLGHLFFFQSEWDALYKEKETGVPSGPIWKSPSWETHGTPYGTFQSTKGCHFSPVGRVEDAWPIIRSLGIHLVCEREDHWSCRGFAPYTHEPIDFEDENPLRAAMLVFLEMDRLSAQGSQSE